jgi:pimeloyl-ACP methyl ester carboxylesterase
MNVVYLHGFASGPTSAKARFFENRFAEAGVRMDVPDLAAGDFEHLTISGQLGVIERVVGGRNAILIGSSMGGYLAALFAARHPNIERLVLMAPAFGVAQRLAEGLGPDAVSEWARSGRRSVYHYGLGRDCDLAYDLMADAAQYEEFPNVKQPTLILHGKRDPVVTFELSLRYASLRPGAEVIPLESGHELTDVMEKLWDHTAAFLGMPRGGGG